MGGRGSGRWTEHNRRATVEDCLSLKISRLRKEGRIEPGVSGMIHFRSGSPPDWEWDPSRCVSDAKRD